MLLLAGACGGRAAREPATPSQVSPSPAPEIPTPAAVAGDPRVVFATGACRRFPPSGADLHRTVFVDPGHGGPDPGGSGRAAGGTIEEKSAALAVALDLLAILRAEGYAVVLSRTADTSVIALTPSDLDHGALTLDANHRDLLARVACANASGAGLLLSIHFNAFGDPSVGGTETFYNAARPFVLANARFATLVQGDVLAALAAGGWSTEDRGTATDASDDAPALSAQSASYPYLLELGPADPGWLDEPSEMPGALCEPLFLSNPSEASIAAVSDGQEAIARGFAQAIAEYFMQPAPGAAPPP